MRPYQLLFDQVLTRTDAERAHRAGFGALRAAQPVTRLVGARAAARAPVTRALGLELRGRLGLAAGFDKNGVGIDALAALGFAFVEIGTVTGEPQPGNPRPRLARLPADRAVVNRMGFNNDGAEVVARRLAERRLDRTGRSGVPLGVNIGKTKVVPEEYAVRDYEKSTSLLTPYADYLVVNVSSPNTPGLRDLQAVDRLEPLLRAVRARADDVSDRHVPLLVKIAPDLEDDDVLAVADLATSLGLDGIVATNTTVSRTGLASNPDQVEAAGAGGLSGRPLRSRATDVVRLLRGRVGDDLVLVGVGGICTLEDALERLAAGADLLQAYTAFVYEGPWWPLRTNRALDRATGGSTGDRGGRRGHRDGTGVEPVTAPFGARLREAMDGRGPLCAGIDPHPSLLDAWGLTDSVNGLERFALTATEVLAPHVAAIKPQSAFFERFGSRGVAVLEQVISTAREAGALVVLDVKRGDIGSTAQAYADAYLDPRSPLAVDAVTATPYLGFGSLDPLLTTAREHGTGVFVLALTSNPEAPAYQRARTAAGPSVAGSVLAELAELNRDSAPLGSYGAVVGATIGEADEDLAINGPLLVPGIGAQGGTADDVRRIFADVIDQVLPSSSREILAAGPNASGLHAAASRALEAFLAVRSGR